MAIIYVIFLCPRRNEKLLFFKKFSGQESNFALDDPLQAMNHYPTIMWLHGQLSEPNFSKPTNVGSERISRFFKVQRHSEPGFIDG